MKQLAMQLIAHSLSHINGLTASEVKDLAARLRNASDRSEALALRVAMVGKKPHHNFDTKTELMLWAAESLGEANALAAAHGALVNTLTSAVVRDAGIYQEFMRAATSEEFQRSVSDAIFNSEFGAN